MSTTTALPENVQIYFRDEETRSAMQGIAERSVATLVARSRARLDQARAAEAELAKIGEAIHAPVTRLLLDNPQASNALDQLRSRKLIEIDTDEPLAQDKSQLSPYVDVPVPRYGGDTLVFRPPFHYAWTWHDHSGFPPFEVVQNRDLGFVRLDARSGLVEGGASGFVNVHAGFGVGLSVDRPARAGAWAFLEDVLAIYKMKTTPGIGSNATTEGGVEVTALRNGTDLVASFGNRLFRRRISQSESTDERVGPSNWPVPYPSPSELSWQMPPGQTFTFNVGAWVFTDRSAGVGGAGAWTRAWISARTLNINRYF